MDIVVTVVVALAVGAAAFLAGRAGGSRQAREEGERAAEARSEEQVRAAESRVAERMRSVAETVAGGRLPENPPPGSPEAALRQALESGWAPREEERRRALREAVERVAGFLHRQVRAPLQEAAPDADAGELRERIERALGSLEDLEFFLQEPPERGSEGQDLTKLVRRVTREFAQDQEVLVRLRLSGPVRADVSAEGFMDALYLILHNAGRFGGGAPVEVTVDEEGEGARVRVRDRGPGFSEEAFQRAFDPFYSTAPDGLGLGLPHARRSLERMGASLELRNSPDGGAEVEITFPAP